MIIIGNHQCTSFTEIVCKHLVIEIEKHFENDSPFTLNSFEIMIPQSSNLPAECF